MYKDSPGTICNDWPEVAGFTCNKSAGDPYKKLDGSINPSQVEKCGILCKQEANAGCCLLGQMGAKFKGCWWKSGSTTNMDQFEPYKSITCSFGMPQRFRCLIPRYLKN